MKIPTQDEVPPKGLYYHYKHDPSKGVTHHAYELMGAGVHTEDDCRPEDANMIVYRPLYTKGADGMEKFFYLRPIKMWTETVMKDEKHTLRFTLITDPDIIIRLEAIKNEMYGS